MFRKFEIHDESGGKLTFKCYPTHPTYPGDDVIVMVEDNISITLHTRKVLNDLVTMVNDFMSHNTINRLEVIEVEE